LGQIDQPETLQRLTAQERNGKGKRKGSDRAAVTIMP
jgi:hypothetical protein